MAACGWWRVLSGQKVEETAKGKMLEAVLFWLVYIALGTLALTQRQEEKLQAAKNNWVNRI